MKLTLNSQIGEHLSSPIEAFLLSGEIILLAKIARFGREHLSP